ncbi:hypothetical protein TA3x_000003 [Tundrisphaera sp. TA3]|uniref:hypothetical protein n=1 Tax=Tundrisphaera sp. TA3 TaxID=3435775 RepID=UPI003EBF1C47
MKDALVIISHYNAWPATQLVSLLDQMREIPAGHPFRARIVVNQAEDKPLELPERHRGIDVFYRENVGYNIGAWDHGWKQEPKADFYLFLQEECVILRPGWLRDFIRAASDPRVGLVGESLELWQQTWEQIDYYRDLAGNVPMTVFGRDCSWSEANRMFLDKHGIRAGSGSDHLQSLILGMRGDVLEKIGGFPLGVTKDEAICSEVAISKAVQALGLRIRQVGLRRFTRIHHPQWEAERAESHRIGWMVGRAFETYLPSTNRRVRGTLSSLKGKVRGLHHR